MLVSLRSLHVATSAATSSCRRVSCSWDQGFLYCEARRLDSSVFMTAVKSLPTSGGSIVNISVGFWNRSIREILLRFGVQSLIVNDVDPERCAMHRNNGLKMPSRGGGWQFRAFI